MQPFSIILISIFCINFCQTEFKLIKKEKEKKKKVTGMKVEK